MFNKNQLTIFDWWIFFILMFIPGINVIVAIILIVSSDTNKSLKNYILASILPVALFIIMWFAFIAAAFVDVGY